MTEHTRSADPAHTLRKPRGRVLVVGEETAPELEACLLQPPLRVGSALEAIGEIARANGRQPIVAAILPDRALAASERRAGEAIKRIDPSVQVISVVLGHESGQMRRPVGVDATLHAPIDPAALERVIGQGYVAAGAAARSQFDPGTGPELERAGIAPVEIPPRTPAPSPPDRAQSEPAGSASPRAPAPPAGSREPAPPRDATGVSPPVIDLPGNRTAIGAPPPPEQTLPAVPAHARDLGDTDLLHAIMFHPDGVTGVALELIRQQTQWPDVQLTEAPVKPGDCACVEVRHRSHTYGTLTSGMAIEKQLLPWADWLAKWLALDSTYREYRLLTYRDDLTGAWNRRYFNRFTNEIIVEANKRRRPLTVMLFDIDNFKRYNDQFGHEAGDVILCETVALLNSVIRKCDRVCRIGGDEFAVIFADLDEPREAGSHHPQSVEEIAKRFQQQVCAMRFPKLGLEAPGTLSISAGLASYPWDGQESTTLLRLADARVLESKRKGKNHITFGPGASEARPGADE